MGRQRFTAESIVRRLWEAEVDLSRDQMVAQTCKKIGVCEQTYYRCYHTTLNASIARSAIIHQNQKQ